MIERILVGKREAAAMLSVSMRTIDNLIYVKALPVRRVGKRVLFRRTDLERFATSDHETRPKPRMGVGQVTGT